MHFFIFVICRAYSIVINEKSKLRIFNYFFFLSRDMNLFSFGFRRGDQFTINLDSNLDTLLNLIKFNN